MKLNIIGNIMGTSGYAVHTRGLANALFKLHDVKLSTMLPPNWELQVNDQEVRMINKPDDHESINLIIDLPSNWAPHLSKKKNICFLVWEGDRIPLSWAEIIQDKRINQVWVPSIHVYNAIKNSLAHWQIDIEGKTRTPDWKSTQLLQKVKIVPHGVDLNIFKPEETKKEIFTFLVNKGFRNELDRGGMLHAIRAFLEEFNLGEAQLILKVNLAYAMSPEQLQDLIIKYSRELKKPRDQIPTINCIYENLLPQQLANLYNQADILLNPTEAEAFSLPSIEAMACGKPVIATNFGGHTDFIDQNNGWLIDYELQEVRHEIFYEGVKWAKPDIKHLKKIMREVYNDKAQREGKAKKALETAKDYTWDNSAQKASIYLKELK